MPSCPVPLGSFSRHMVQNAAAVPHIAMTLAVIKRKISSNPYRCVSAIFAEMGPMTQMTKAEKDPRKAIEELNSGTSIDIPTDRSVNRTLSTTNNARRAACWQSLGDDSLSTEKVFGSREDCKL